MPISLKKLAHEIWNCHIFVVFLMSKLNNFDMTQDHETIKFYPHIEILTLEAYAWLIELSMVIYQVNDFTS